MRPLHEIRADFDRDTIVVYQAYPASISGPAVKNGLFVPPFSFNRMTWIKPSFLWLMHRSNWAQKSGQECILAIRISRSGWEKALSNAVLTTFETSVHQSKPQWADAFANAKIHVQWDPERNLRGAAQQHYSIQIGIGRQIIQEYNESWIVSLTDITATVVKMRSLIQRGDHQAASRHLPIEKSYPVSTSLGRHLLLSSPAPSNA